MLSPAKNRPAAEGSCLQGRASRETDIQPTETQTEVSVRKDTGSYDSILEAKGEEEGKRRLKRNLISKPKAYILQGYKIGLSLHNCGTRSPLTFYLFSSLLFVWFLPRIIWGSK